MCGERDAVARVGGDEFAVILSGLEPEQAAESWSNASADRVAHTFAIRRHEVASDRQRRLRDARTGNPVLPQEAMAAADRFLRQAKEQGRDRTVGGPYEHVG